jgi:hypothetical protein
MVVSDGPIISAGQVNFSSAFSFFFSYHQSSFSANKLIRNVAVHLLQGGTRISLSVSLLYQVAFLLGIIPIFVAWIYSEFLESKKTSSLSKL